MQPREALICMAYKYKGKWNDIYYAIKRREDITQREYEDAFFNLKCSAITLLDESYPEYLKHTPRPPFVMFYYGDISLIQSPDNNLAVIGTRKPSDYGAWATSKLISTLNNDFTIVSGMAVGVDSIGQKKVLEMNGKTIAVLGSGIDVCWPPSNKKLYEDIKKKGLVISEYPSLTQPQPDFFRMRNRLVAAFSKGILITEAKPRSGTSITVDYALNIGRRVMCVPNRINEDSFCNTLIARGADLIMNADDIRLAMDKETNSPDFEE